MVLTIILVAVALGVYFYTKKKKTINKGGSGGTEKDNYQDPDLPIYK